MTKIACLHTAESNIAVFEKALVTTGLKGINLSHTVRPDLLADAELHGGLTDSIAQRTMKILQELSEGADTVLLTCSTLGPSADALAEKSEKPILRVDAALASEAVRDGGHVIALCAVETTVAPTRDLFERVAGATGAKVDVQLVQGAWEVFKSGDNQAYLQMIADAAHIAIKNGATKVALAQASMAGAVELMPNEAPVLDSPQQGLFAAVTASV